MERMAGNISIDGRPFQYRNPYNQQMIDQQYDPDEGLDQIGPNKHSYEYTNPLYDYSYGAVRDAATAEGIKNVNSQEEVDKIIARIQGLNEKSKDNESDADEEVPVVEPPPAVTAPIGGGFEDEDPISDLPDMSSSPVVTPPQTNTGPATGGGSSYLSPGMSVNQNNPVTITGNKNQVDNSINQMASDMSDNRVFYGGSNFNLTDNPALEDAVNMITEDKPRYSEGIDFMNSPSNASNIVNSENFKNNFMRNRLFDMK